jgi:hypothetical protein
MHIFLVYGPFLWAQNNYGDPVLNQSFGEGDSNPYTIGSPLQAGATNFCIQYRYLPATRKLHIGKAYKFRKVVFNNEWILLDHNHTPYDDFGMIMIVNKH